MLGQRLSRPVVVGQLWHTPFDTGQGYESIRYALISIISNLSNKLHFNCMFLAYSLVAMELIPKTSSCKKRDWLKPGFHNSAMRSHTNTRIYEIRLASFTTNAA